MGYTSLSNASRVFASSDKSQTGGVPGFSAPGCGNENIVSKMGDAIDRITLCALNWTACGPPDRRIMSAVGESSKLCGMTAEIKDVTVAGVCRVRLSFHELR